MSSRQQARLPVVISIILALLMTMVPLPGWLDTYRPDWVALVLIYWTMMLPQQYSVGTAWLAGVVLDVAQGTMLGQHALALVAIIFLTSRFHLLMRVFPMSQLTLTVFALLAIYQFLLFWINGVAGVAAPAASYWGPVITGTLFWPLVTGILSGLRFRNLARS
jgi:rod shape-determining protein MreD